MLFGVLRSDKRKLWSGAAVLLMAGMSTGCSSQMMRFNTTDDVFTGSTSNQRQVINHDNQSYPGDTVAAAPVDRVTTASVSSSELPPPSSPSVQNSAPVAPAKQQVSAKERGEAPFKAASEPLERTSAKTGAKASQSVTKVETAANKLQQPSKSGQMVASLPEKAKAKETAAAMSGSTTSAGKLAKSGGYTVASGDTLSKISRRTGVSVASLKAANGIEDGKLKIGQTLKVPADGTVAKISPSIDKVSTASIEPAAKKATETSAAVSETAVKKADTKVIEQAEASTEKAPNATGIEKMRWPVRGKVISSYGKSAGKSGIDIAVPEGTPVKAAENGVVIYAGDGLKDFGNTVLVRHDNGLVTVYGNASQLNVKRGQKVKRGEDIAVSGMSGSAESPKLHFEVRKNSAPVDPSGYLE